MGPKSPASLASEDLPLVFDAHVHLMSQGLVDDWKSLGVPFSRPDSAYTMAATGFAQARSTEIDAAGPNPDQAILIPMAHFYGNGEFRGALGLSVEQEQQAAAAENDHVLEQARAFSGRAWAVCGVDILRPWAMDEIRRCTAPEDVIGLKLHLASAGVDLTSAEHRARIAAALDAVAALDLTVWMHLDTQSSDLEVDDVEDFAGEVFGPRPGLRIVIAHMGGSGGYGPWSREVYRALAEWLEQESAAGRDRPDYRFDISAIWLPEESEGVPASTRADAVALRSDLIDSGQTAWSTDPTTRSSTRRPI